MRSFHIKQKFMNRLSKEIKDIIYNIDYRFEHGKTTHFEQLNEKLRAYRPIELFNEEFAELRSEMQEISCFPNIK